MVSNSDWNWRRASAVWFCAYSAVSRLANQPIAKPFYSGIPSHIPFHMAHCHYGFEFEINYGIVDDYTVTQRFSITI